MRRADQGSPSRPWRIFAFRVPLRFNFPALPELPDITVYIEALERRVVGRVL